MKHAATVLLFSTLIALSNASAGPLDPDCTAEKAAKSAAMKATVGVGGRCSPKEAVTDTVKRETGIEEKDRKSRDDDKGLLGRDKDWKRHRPKFCIIVPVRFEQKTGLLVRTEHRVGLGRHIVYRVGLGVVRHHVALSIVNRDRPESIHRHDLDGENMWRVASLRLLDRNRILKLVR
jgi:hypothetical protein